MNILVTGSNGFVGKNLVENLKNIRDGKNQTRSIKVDKIFEYDKDSTEDDLNISCRNCDFVFNLAGMNRPKINDEFMVGNYGFASKLLDTLKKYQNTCPVMLSSSIQATLIGRYGESDYGKSKLAGEELFFKYGVETGTKVLIYRFSNLFGKWCRPKYNSAVATFCNAIANDEPYTVNDRNTSLNLIYIDDLIDEMFNALEGKEHRCEFDGLTPVKNPSGRFCYVPISHNATLGTIVDLLNTFKKMPIDNIMPEIPKGSFEKKLFSTYLSYLPVSKMSYGFNSNIDERGNFTELIKTVKSGQVSINITKPGNVRGQHWHNSKWEIFIVVAGHGLIQERKIGSDEVVEFEVSEDELRAVVLLPGYTHNIINLSNEENLVTVIWANEQFDQKHPDTFREMVIRD